LSLHDDVLHGVDVGSVADLYMADFMPATQTKDPLQTADVEGLEGFDVMPSGSEQCNKKDNDKVKDNHGDKYKDKDRQGPRTKSGTYIDKDSDRETTSARTK